MAVFPAHQRPDRKFNRVNQNVALRATFCILDRSGSMSGLENASRRYGSEKVKRMIERQKEKYGAYVRRDGEGGQLDAVQRSA